MEPAGAIRTDFGIRPALVRMGYGPRLLEWLSNPAQEDDLPLGSYREIVTGPDDDGGSRAVPDQACWSQLACGRTCLPA